MEKASRALLEPGSPCLSIGNLPHGLLAGEVVDARGDPVYGASIEVVGSDVAGLPIEGMGILLAVDTIPDMFRTTANVTGTMVLTAILPGESADDVRQDA